MWGAAIPFNRMRKNKRAGPRTLQPRLQHKILIQIKHLSVEINIDKFLANFLFQIARNLSVSIKFMNCYPKASLGPQRRDGSETEAPCLEGPTKLRRSCQGHLQDSAKKAFSLVCTTRCLFKSNTSQSRSISIIFWRESFFKLSEIYDIDLKFIDCHSKVSLVRPQRRGGLE